MAPTASTGPSHAFKLRTGVTSQSAHRGAPRRCDVRAPRRVNGRAVAVKPAARKKLVSHHSEDEHADDASRGEVSASPEAEPRLIAFYLPQYHPIPENDRWWGKGFTEWPGTAGAQPLFEDHYQPHIPADLGFYDLRLPEARAAQAELAKQYGIHGFCYHYYWFSGRRILQRPLDEMLQSGKPNFPFCICWANEPWSRRWDGSESEILIAQEHDLDSDKKLIFDLLPLFADRRYIKVNGKPLLVIYRVGLLPNPGALFAAWREAARQHGLPDLHICMAETFGLNDPFASGCDSAVEFPPHQLVAGPVNDSLKGLAEGFSGTVYNYADAVMAETVAAPADYQRYRCVMPGWDNTPRRGRKGNLFHGATPELYELWLREAIGFTRRHLPAGQRLVFINAWNEWGEGAHIEPDIRFGRQFLEATRRAMAGLSEWRTIMTATKTKLPAGEEDLTALEAWLRSFETALKYMSEQYLSLETQRLGLQPAFVNFSESVLAPLGVQLKGSCNIERINQISDGDMIAVDQTGYLQISGWNLIAGEEMTAETVSYLTLLSMDGEQAFTARIQQRVPRADVAEYHKLPSDQGLWSGIRSSVRLSSVDPGKYEIGIDTRIGSSCLRALSSKVVVIGQQ
jgi:hypothetical protein